VAAAGATGNTLQHADSRGALERAPLFFFGSVNPGPFVTSNGMMIALLALFLQAGHVFQPVDPAWRLHEDTLERRSDSFIVVRPKDRVRRDYWREKRYSQDGQERKLFRYDPQGRLRLEVDSIEGDRFTRILRADGSLASYQHHREFRLIEAFSFSRDGRTVHHVQDGIGELVVEGEEGTWTHLQLLPEITIEKAYRGDQLGRISIWIGSDHYLRTPDQEELSLDAPAEHWTVQGPSVDLEITAWELAGGRIRPRARAANPDVRPRPVWHSDLPQGLVEEWEIAWPKRRAAFMTRVEEALKAAELDPSHLPEIPNPKPQ
jgi:hypothetical protein